MGAIRPLMIKNGEVIKPVSLTHKETKKEEARDLHHLKEGELLPNTATNMWNMLRDRISCCHLWDYHHATQTMKTNKTYLTNGENQDLDEESLFPFSHCFYKIMIK